MSTRSTKQSWGWLIGLTSTFHFNAGELAGISSLAIATVLLASTVAEAGQLSQWRYDEANHQLELTLSDSTTPQHFLLAQPARIVIDLPNTQLGEVPAEQMLSGAVRSIRVSQFQPTVARVVIELSPEAVLAASQVNVQQTNGSNLVIQPVFAGDVVNAPDVAIAPSPTPPASALPQAASAPSPSPEVQSLEPADSNLPPLEPGAVELAVIPPGATPPAPATASEDSIPSPEATTAPTDTEDLAVLEVPSIEPAIAQLNQDGMESNPLADRPAIADEPTLETAVENVEPDSEYRYDPTEPVLDATVPTERPPVLDGTQPSAMILVPPQAATPQDALTQLSQSAPAAVAIPVLLTESPSDSSSSTPAQQPETAQPVPTSTPAQVDAGQADQPEIMHIASEETEPSVEEIEVLPASEPPPVSVPPLSTPEEPRSPIAFGQPISGDAEPVPPTAISPGTTVNLRYPGETPLALDPGTRQEVLLLQQPIKDARGNIVAEAGSPVIGRFETSDSGSKFVIQAIAASSQTIRVAGESQVIQNQENLGVAENSAAVAESSFNPAALFSGVASSAVTRVHPSSVVIQPDQVITVQITEDVASR